MNRRALPLATACAVGLLAGCGGNGPDPAADPEVQATRARVAEGLRWADDARWAVEETYLSRHDAPISRYAGIGLSAASSFGYAFAPTPLVHSIKIAAVTASPVTPAAGTSDGAITIAYAAAVGGVPGSIVLYLTPGSGAISTRTGLPVAPLTTRSPIVWGCTAGDTNIQYVPASCPFGVPLSSPQYSAMQAERAAVAEGLHSADSAKLAVSESYSSNPGAALAAYTGTGAPAAGSFGYQFVPSTLVSSIAIAAVTATPVTPAAGTSDGAITITYAAAVGVSGLTLYLTPGSGPVPASTGLPAAPLSPRSPVVWGCTAGSRASQFVHVPANCRS
jgi:type IV pilus assembly protein PilA